MATFTGQANTDNDFLGTSGNDVFRFAVADLNALDMIVGNGGLDRLLLTSSGALAANALAGMRGVGRITLAAGGNSLSLFDAQYSVAIADSRIQVNGGAGADRVDASALSAANSLFFIGGGGIDTVLGGAGDDIFSFGASGLSADTVRGNGGNDRLDLGQGTYSYFDLNDVQGIETFNLSGGDNVVQLATSNFAGVIGGTIFIITGGSVDEVDASAVTNGFSVDIQGSSGLDVLRGGAGDDHFHGRIWEIEGDIIQGNGGFDTLTLTSSGAITAASLAGVQGIEQIVLVDAPTAVNSIGLGNGMFSGITSGRIAIVGGTGDDSVDASALTFGRSVEVTAGAGADRITGGLGNDLFRGVAAHIVGDVMHGGGGTDVLEIISPGTLGANALAGMQSVEQVWLSESGNGVTLTDANFGSLNSYRMKVVGGMGNDVVNASALTGGNSVEFLGGAGIDVLRGGAGDDLFRTSSTQLMGDTIIGNDGYDTLYIQSPVVQPGNALAGVQGVELILLETGANRISLTDANFVGVTFDEILVSGGLGNDRVDASAVTGPHSVILQGNGGRDTLIGGAGADVFIYDPQDVRAIGGGGADTMMSLMGGAFDLSNVADQSSDDDVIMTGFENISLAPSFAGGQLFGNAGTNELTGGEGDDLIDGRGGADVIEAGGGDDDVTYGAGAVSIAGGFNESTGWGDRLLLIASATVDLSIAADQVLGGGVTTGFESVDAAGSSGAVTLTGSNIFASGLGGSAFDDIITAGAAGSIINGMDGADTMIGGGAGDIFVYDQSGRWASGETIDGGGGYDNVMVFDTMSFLDPMFTNVEQITLSSNQELTLSAVNARSVGALTGTYLDGETQTFFVNLSAGQSIDLSNVVLVNPDAGDSLTIRGAAGAETVTLSQGTLTYRGGNGDDIIRAGAFATYGAGSGIYGDAGDDRIDYRDNDGIISGGSGFDTLVLRDAATVNLSQSADQVTGGGITTGFEAVNAAAVTSAVSLTGASVTTSWLIGGTATDILAGGDAADRLTGGNGADELTGGGGSDRFIWRNAAEGGDILTDFVAGTDDLYFVSANFGFTVANFDVRTAGGAGVNLAATDLFIYSGVLDDAGDVQALLDSNATGGSGNALFVVARDAASNTVVYHTAFADGSGTVDAMANLGAGVAPSAIGLADFLFG